MHRGCFMNLANKKQIGSLIKKCKVLTNKCDDVFENEKNISINGYDRLISKALYSLRLLHLYLLINDDSNNNPFDINRFTAYLESTIDYARLLNYIGRKIPALRIYKQLLNRIINALSRLDDVKKGLINFNLDIDDVPQINNVKNGLIYVKSIVEGNLGETLFYYPYIKDSYSKYFILQRASKYLRLALSNKSKQNSQSLKLYKNIYERSQKDIKNCRKSPQSYITIRNIQEFRYRKWVCNNCLALNVLNDADSQDINISSDNLSITRDSDNDIFYLIKQEYISARYQTYYGLKHCENDISLSKIANINYKSDNHLSDRHRYMSSKSPNISNYYIEQMKSAFKSFSSIFNQIAYLLIHYFDVDLSYEHAHSSNKDDYPYNDRKIDFNNIYKDPAKTFILRDSHSYVLEGLYWISKDLKGFYWKKWNSKINVLININTHLDASSREIRDDMEHRCLHITEEELSSDDPRWRNKEHYDFITFNTFKLLAIHFMKTCREAITLFTFVLNSK